jgi:hypothetical protein
MTIYRQKVTFVRSQMARRRKKLDIPGATTNPGLAVQRSLPRVEALLRRELSEDEAKAWLRHLSAMSLSEDELLVLVKNDVVELAPATHAVLKRQLLLWRYQISHWWNHKRKVNAIVYASAWLTLLASATFKAGLGWFGWITGAIVLVLKARAVLGEYDPRHLPLMRRTMTERHLLLCQLIQSLQLWLDEKPSAREREKFQADVLRLITLFVRDHRSDLKGKTIFSNLLVEDGENLVVRARSDGSRPVPQTYTRAECSIAWSAIETRRAQWTGDVYDDAPDTKPGKAYNSILVMPIFLANQVLGVVSIDSEAKFHFDIFLDEITNALAPYVQLLAVTLQDDHDTSRQLPPVATTGGAPP